MSTPYTFDDEDEEFTQSQQQDGDEATSPDAPQEVNAKPKVADFSAIKADQIAVTKEFTASAKKLSGSADALKSAVDALKDGIKEAFSENNKPSQPAESQRPPIASVKSPEIQKADPVKFEKPAESQQPPAETKKDQSWQSPNVVPGKETSRDAVNVKAKSGEYIFRPEAVKALGIKFLDKLNSTKQKPPEMHARGGIVGKMQTHCDYRSPEKQPKGYAMGGLVEHAQNAVSGYRIGSAEARRGDIAGSIAAGAVNGAMVGGPLGAAIGGVVAGLKSVASTATETAARLGKFSGQLAAANARSNYRQIVGDVQRSQFLSPQLSRFTDATSKLSQTGQDASATLLKAGLRVIVPLLENTEKLIEKYGDPIAEHLAQMAEGLSALYELFGDFPLIGPLAKSNARVLDGVATDIREINFRGKNRNVAGGIDFFMQQFLNGAGKDNSTDFDGGNGANVIVNENAGAVNAGLAAGPGGF